MNAGNVAQFGCARLHPTRIAYCDRQRHHAGDHRGRDSETGRLLEWADPPYVHTRPQEDPVPESTDHEPTVAFEAWHDTEAVPTAPPGEPLELQGELLERDDRLRSLHGGFWAGACAIEVVVLILLILCAPAIIAAVYRWGF